MKQKNLWYPELGKTLHMYSDEAAHQVFTTKFCSTFKSHYHKNYIYFYYFHLSILIIPHIVVQFSFLYIKWVYYELRYDNEQKLFVKMFK